MTLFPTAPSIRALLLWGTAVTLLAVLGATAWLAFEASQHEAEEVFDARLATSARVLEALIAHHVETAAVAPIVVDLPLQEDAASHGEISAYSPHYETKLAFQVRSKSGRLLVHSTTALDHSFVPMKPGFSDQQHGGRSWRVFTLDSGQAWIWVAERNDVRSELARDLALIVVIPLLAGIPLLLLVFHLLIRYSLAPLSELARSIALRHPSSLSPVALSRESSEITPVLTALNRLLQRVKDTLERERRFTQDAAHELRTPLAGLHIHAQNAVRAATEDERQASLQHLLKGLQRTIRMSEQMLDYGRVSASADNSRHDLVSLRQVVEETVEHLRPACSGRALQIEVSRTPETADMRVRGDAYKLHNLVRNLLDNACRHAPDGSAIRVELDSGQQRITLAVTDEGPGIPPELRQRVFESYYRIPGTSGPGSGLGLAIVKEVALQHGASVSVDDGFQGRGTRVVVVFPPAV